MPAPLAYENTAAPVEVLEPVVPTAGSGRLKATTVYSTQEERVDYRVLLRRHRRAVLGIFTACCLGGLGWQLLAPKSYTVETVLEITGLNHDYLNTRDVDVDAGRGTPDAYLDTQVAILQNEAVTDRVVAAVAPSVPPKLAADGERREALVRSMLLGMKAKQQGQSDLVMISLSGPSGRLAADTANQLTGQYIAQGQENRLAEISETGSFLKEQLADAKLRVGESERALQEYAKASNIVLTDDTHESVAAEHLRELQQGLAQAEVDAANTASQAEMAARGSAETLPDVVNDLELRDTATKHTELRRQLADAGTTLTPENYRVQKLQAQIAELEGALARQRAVIVQKLQVQNQQARRREQLLKLTYDQQMAVVTDQGGKQVRYNMLKHEADVDRTVYQSMLQKAKEAGVMAAMRTPNARVVSPAKTPRLPSSPKASICALLSVLVGAVLSGLYIVLAERRNRAVRSPGESGQRIDCLELAVIPQSRAAIKRPKVPPSLAAGIQHPMLRHWKDADKTFMAEAYRSAVTSILFSRPGSGPQPRVLLVTSPLPQCGKTVTSANLAVSLAEGGRRVLLIDGDLRRPALPQVFGLDLREGLADTLEEGREIDPRDLIQATGYQGVSILASGPVRGSVGKLLHSKQLPGVIRSASQGFDFVLIDTPPLLGLADARLLARCSDGLILVCRAGRTSMEDLDEAQRLLSEDGIRVLGTILNDYDLQRERSSHYSSYLTYVDSH